MYYHEMVEEAKKGNLIIEEVDCGQRTINRYRWDLKEPEQTVEKAYKSKKYTFTLHRRSCRTKDMPEYSGYRISKKNYKELKKIIDCL